MNRSLTSTLDRMMTLNRAIDEAFTAGTLDNVSQRVWVPVLDVVEKPDAYLVVLELPGVERSQVELSFEQKVLTIKGTKGSVADAAEGEVRVHAAERVSGRFERAIRLPELVDGESISAELTNGLLTVRVPKAPTAQPRRIEIQGN